jgi:hypothetical protein
MWKTPAIRTDATTSDSDFSSSFVFIVFTVAADPPEIKMLVDTANFDVGSHPTAVVPTLGDNPPG